MDFIFGRATLGMLKILIIFLLKFSLWIRW